MSQRGLTVPVPDNTHSQLLIVRYDTIQRPLCSLLLSNTWRLGDSILFSRKLQLRETVRGFNELNALFSGDT